MLSKGIIYSGYAKPYKGGNQQPSKNFRKVKVLFEDSISYYVESLTSKDSIGNGMHYSVKKHCFELIPYYQGEPKMTEKQILEQSIANHQRAIDIAKLALADLEVTYSVGDRFTGPHGKYILVILPPCEATMVNLENACYWGALQKFNCLRRITQAEFTKAYGEYTFTRYWDYQKKVKCN